MEPSRRRVWITWEKQRRSETLSGHVGAPLHMFDDEKLGLVRYPVSAFKTLALLWSHRGQIVFVQNPSMVLTVMACLLRPLLRYLLVVDRHSDLVFWQRKPDGAKKSLYHFLHRYTSRAADLTIVTNSELGALMVEAGARTFNLPNPYPDFPAAPARAPGKPFTILFVSTWEDDEPILEAMEACRALGDDVLIRITGRPKAKFAEALKSAPRNFVSTGFLSDRDYFARMAESDCVLAVTKYPLTLVCGAYESVSSGKPMILGDTPTLRGYFSKGAVYTDGSAADLAAKIREMVAEHPRMQAEVREFLPASRERWLGSLSRLNRALETPR